MTDSPFSPEQDAFLRQQKWAVLATGRRDGSPQVSTVGYYWDGRDLVVSAKRYTAKWHNALRQPRVALLVHEGRKQLVIYGRAEGISDDPERLRLTLRVIQRLQDEEPSAPKPGDAPLDDGELELQAVFDEQQRTILRITPEKAFLND